jgi:hypothetical protein
MGDFISKASLLIILSTLPAEVEVSTISGSAGLAIAFGDYNVPLVRLG